MAYIAGIAVGTVTGFILYIMAGGKNLQLGAWMGFLGSLLGVAIAVWRDRRP